MPVILAIESSCDDTAASVIADGKILSNVISSQPIHSEFGGVVPELASRAHQGNIAIVVDKALSDAGIKKEALNAVAFTQGPGLMGSLLVGVSFAKAMSLSLGIPMIAVDHLHAHIASHFIEKTPHFPMLCLLASGGHTLIIKVNTPLQYNIIGRTTDDAAGEAFDKAAKILGLPYPGGPLIDKYSKKGNYKAYTFPEPDVPGLDFSFSGLKTSFMYFLLKEQKKNPDFIQENLYDICASYQHRIVTYLLHRLHKASLETGIKTIGLAGGVAANSYLRKMLAETAAENNWRLILPALSYCTDNAAMVAMVAHYKYLAGEFAAQDVTPYANRKLS